MNILKLWKHHIRKRCIFTLFLYTVSTFFIISLIKSNVYPDIVSCSAHSPKELEAENSFYIRVDSYVRKLFTISQENRSEFLNETKSSWTKFSSSIYVFSAYVDRCVENSFASSTLYCIKLVGMYLHDDYSKVNCAIKTDEGVTFKTGSAEIEIVEEHHEMPFTAAFFYCPLVEIDTIAPSRIKYVSLYINEYFIWHSVYPLSPSFNKTNDPSVRISLCVRPFFGFYHSMQLLEFITYYTVMGVDHFIFYKDKTSEAMNPFFFFATSLNISIEILPWDIPLSNYLIHEYGQVVFTQECIAHSKYDFTHTLIVDVDEYIVPKKHNNLREFLQCLDSKHKDASNYVIPMTFFCNEYTIENSSHYLHILTHNRRQKTPWQHKLRSKYILKPDKVLHGGIHFVWKSVKGSRDVLLPDSLVLVHHYRHCCGVQQTWFLQLFNFYVLSDEVVVDDTLANHRYKILNYSLLNGIPTSDSINELDYI